EPRDEARGGHRRGGLRARRRARPRGTLQLRGRGRAGRPRRAPAGQGRGAGHDPAVEPGDHHEEAAARDRPVSSRFRCVRRRFGRRRDLRHLLLLRRSRVLPAGSRLLRL
ncbi:MAG: hypothetical protein AVDCRST_MAG39-1717, partial [uncultured Sphingomonadaceae bacterium]